MNTNQRILFLTRYEKIKLFNILYTIQMAIAKNREAIYLINKRQKIYEYRKECFQCYYIESTLLKTHFCQLH